MKNRVRLPPSVVGRGVGGSGFALQQHSSSSLWRTYFHHHHHHHLSLNREGRWGTTDDFISSFLYFFSVLHCPLGLGELQACPFPDVVFPPLLLSALFSSPLSPCFAKWLWPDLMMNVRHVHTTAVVFLDDGQKVFVWSDCLLDLGTDFLIGNTVFVWDA